MASASHQEDVHVIMTSFNPKLDQNRKAFTSPDREDWTETQRKFAAAGDVVMNVDDLRSMVRLVPTLERVELIIQYPQISNLYVDGAKRSASSYICIAADTFHK